VELLNAAAHNKPALVVEHLRQALPLLYAQTVIDESLIRIVDLGPFKHKIDDGLELRKAAFECMDVVFESCPDNIDYAEFMGPLQSGLSVGSHLSLPLLDSKPQGWSTLLSMHCKLLHWPSSYYRGQDLDMGWSNGALKT
jgi:hypothetical protein